MSGTSLLLLVLSSTFLGTTAGLLVACMQLPMVRYLTRFRTASQYTSGFWFVWANLPLLFGSSLALIALASGELSSRGWIEDHCLEHPGHPHLCLNHIAAHPPGGLFLALAFLVISIPVCSAIQLGGSVRSFWRRLLTLPANSTRTGIVTLQTQIPMAFAAGLFRPRCYLSQGLLETLHETQQEIVIAHERAHLQRGDPWRLLLLRWSETWLPGVRSLREKWQEASEVECDQACVAMGYDRRQIAATILQLQRRGGVLAGAFGLPYASSSATALRHRIECVLRLPAPRSAAVLLSLSGLVLVAAGFAFFEIHHALETVLGWLT